MKKVKHLYVHIPFCESRCGYCDFYSNRIDGDGVPETYVKALRRELDLVSGLLGGLTTIYIGGGTPSLLGPALTRDLLAAVIDHADPGAEVTMEGNPSSATEKLLVAAARAGVNRLSLGAQSFNNSLRARLGRGGDSSAAGCAVRSARDAGIGNISIDLLFGIPGQSSEELLADLKTAISLRPEHISCYELTVKEGGDYWRRWRPELEEREESIVGFYGIVRETLTAAGYQGYEVSNYARPGFECEHNRSYWRGDDYVGIGAGAWSTIGLRRWRNSERLDSYLEDPLRGREEEELNDAQKRGERLMLGLRTSQGVSREQVESVVDPGEIEFLERQGLIRVEKGVLSLSGEGQLLANEIVARIWRG